MEFVMEPFMWLGIVALFLVIEAVTVGLTTIWFAGGALVAAVASGLGPVRQFSGSCFCRVGDTSDFYQTSGGTVYEQRRRAD